MTFFVYFFPSFVFFFSTFPFLFSFFLSFIPCCFITVVAFMVLFCIFYPYRASLDRYGLFS